MKCSFHTTFFDDSCEACKQEYFEMKGVNEPISHEKQYKQFSEERAKKLYEELMLQYLKNGLSEADASHKAKAIIKKQCGVRGMPPWPWV